MSMKRILRIKKPPLDRIIIRILFSEDLRLNVSISGEIAKKIKDSYPNEPNLVLLPILRPGMKIDLPPMGPLKFTDEKNFNWIEIGKDYIIFTFTEYFNWAEVLEKSINIIFILKENLDLKEVIDVQMKYVDKFIFLKEDFRFKDNFTINFDKPEILKILPHDFFIGIVPHEDDNKKLVLRLKGIEEGNNLKYNLETEFISKNLKLEIEKEDLANYLTEAHDLIEQYFIEFLTEDLRNKIGMELK